MTDREILLGHFRKIADIPHGSRNTEALRAALETFAKEQGCETQTDEAGNLLIIKEASEGAENAAPVILQGHLDMVCEAADGVDHDFTNEPLDVRITPDGEWLSAEGTTLGADDGIALSYMLALIESKTIRHPKLFLLMTNDEEIGMFGAADMDPEWISDAARMINLDSEEEGVFTVGGAGGLVISGSWPVERELVTGTRWRISVSGLTGGHSGAEIDRFGAHAVRLIASLLEDTMLYLDSADTLRLVGIRGGDKDNVITKTAQAEVLTTGNGAQFQEVFEQMSAMYRRMYADADPGMKIVLEKTAVNKTESAISSPGTRKVCFILSQIPYGVQYMEKGGVRQSLNLGKVETTDKALTAVLGLRGNTPDQIQVLADRVSCFIVGTGGTPDIGDAYPSWPEKKNSALLDMMTKSYEDEYGISPEVLVIHGGLECGLIIEKLPDLDIVSIGPELENVHTPEERMRIPSAMEVFRFLKLVLAKLADDEEPAEADDDAADQDYPADQTGDEADQTAADTDAEDNADAGDSDESASDHDDSDDGPAVITRTSGEVLTPSDVCGKNDAPADCAGCEAGCEDSEKN